MYRSPLFLTLAIALIAAPAYAADDDRPLGCQPDTSAEANTVRNDRVFRKACHNCYETQYSATFKGALNNTHNVEVDFWDTEDAVTGGKPNAWFVRHEAGAIGTTGGNHNNCSVVNGSNDLAACLQDVAEWSQAHPAHDVIAVFMDKKQDFGEDRQPADLDALILSKVPRSKIFAPADLKGTHPDLRTAAQNGSWPKSKNLKNKIMFVLTGGTLLHPNSTQSHYVEQRGTNAILFVAPFATQQSDVDGTPDQFTAATAQNVVFYNVERRARNVSIAAYSKNYLTRVYGADEDDKTYTKLLSQCVNFIALFNFANPGFNNGRLSGVLKRSQ